MLPPQHNNGIIIMKSIIVSPLGSILPVGYPDLDEAVRDCQKFSDEFKEFEQPVYVSDEAEDNGRFSCYQRDYNNTKSWILGPAEGFETLEKAQEFANSENSRIRSEIIGGFQTIEVPDSLDVEIGSVEQGSSPRSRKVTVWCGEERDTVFWNSGGLWMRVDLVCGKIKEMIKAYELEAGK